MIRIVKESFTPLKVYEGETFAVLRPLFWGKAGADEIAVHYKNGEPSQKLQKVVRRCKKILENKLIGKSQRVMIEWSEDIEFERIIKPRSGYEKRT